MTTTTYSKWPEPVIIGAWNLHRIKNGQELAEYNPKRHLAELI